MITKRIERIDDFNKLSTFVMNGYIGSINFLLEFEDQVVELEDGQKLYPDIHTDALEAQELVAAGILIRTSKYTSQTRSGSSPVQEEVIYQFSYLGTFLYEYGLK